MGEVLENGVYLPDEGERNAYNGLKGNWNTVDTVVAQVQALSSAGLIRKPVDELPTEDIETNVIYMLKAVKPNGDVYRIEYMYIDNHWDALGTSETTLDDYYTKAETDDLPAVKSGINATRVSNYNTHLANNDIHVTLANKQSWNGKQNALDTAQTAAVNSGVTAAKVTGYDTHVSDTDVHVTTSDKTAWNGKQDGLSQTQLAAVNSGITEAKRTGYDSHVADTDAHVTTADKAAWNGKQNALTQTQLDNIAAVPDKADSADLATVATTGDYGDLLNAPTIPTVNNASLTIQKNGADVATFTANASSNVTANLAIPVNTSDLNNDAGFLTQHNPVDNELSATSENALQNKVVKSELDGKAPLVHTHAASDITSGTFNIARIPNLDASKITSGTIDIARLPKGALERLVKVANQAARYALTTDDVQLGDTVQQLDTGVMYVVTDETKLDSADGYTEFTAGAASSVPWTGVTGKPNDYPPSSHTHTKSQITDFPALATVATSGSYNDLSNIPASFTPSSHTHGNITNDGKVGTAANVPLITGTGGAVQAGSFGNQANTFCEGNDSRLSDARTPVAHTHTKSDVTDLFNSANTWSGENTFSAPCKTLGKKLLTDITDLDDAYYNGEVCGFNPNTLHNPTNGYGNVLTINNAVNVPDHIYSSWITQIAASASGGYLGIRNRSNGGAWTSWTRILTEDHAVPTVTNTYDLGSSSYQWNNLYAKNYFYNGTAWGLDKANVWSAWQTQEHATEPLIRLRRSNLQIGDPIPASQQIIGTIPFADKNNLNLGLIACRDDTNGDTYLTLTVRQRYDSNGRANNGTQYESRINLGIDSSKNLYLRPNSNGQIDLGTSTNRWKTLNGINPGALSLPDVSDGDPISTVGWSLTGARNTYTPTENGWFFIRVKGTASAKCSLNIHSGSYNDNYPTWVSYNDPTISLSTSLVVPAQKSVNLYVYIIAAEIEQLIFYPCLGNV